MFDGPTSIKHAIIVDIINNPTYHIMVILITFTVYIWGVAAPFMPVPILTVLEKKLAGWVKALMGMGKNGFFKLSKLHINLILY